ncbi:hypothetical protein BGW38_007506 [Lunasporangiospora selenospora]|uniref:Uncharacterized protein n=1 Tax=Lunasporangiospora selenospora TaxID=979761 RepID=A0A9P6FLC6_9FUNG|nr:hypothetical protein BGW38_007506 [Lunasporangiospora selenospora]
MSQLGIPDNEATDRQDQRNYFRRMALRCKERFEEDGAGVSDMDSKALPSLPTEQGDGARDEQHHWDRLHFHHLRRLFRRTESVQEEEMEGALVAARFVPREDPKEMKAAHRAFYKRRHGARSRWSIRKEGDGEDSNSDSEEDDDDEEDKKLFGSWWGCHSRRTDEERFLDKQIEQEWEKIHMPRDKDEKRKSLQEQNGSVSLEVTLRNGNGSKMSLASQKWWKTLQGDAASISSSTSQQDRKAITKKHQALAAAAAYEAMKEYQARQIRQGKKVSHGEMKAILAGMAMAEAVKLLEMHLAHQDKRKAGSGSESDGEDDGDDDNDQRDETVAEAGSKVLRLFELMRS